MITVATVAHAQEQTVEQPSVAGASCVLIPGAELIEFDGSVTIARALQGKVAGLQVSSSNGAVGSRTSMRLRGNNSIYGAATPLVFLDGVRMHQGGFTQRVGFAGDSGPLDGAGPVADLLDSINPADVRAIAVLRGPSATTLYGTEAAAGVIHIFTKRGGGTNAAVDPKNPCY